jgi:hypothetical protein
LSTVVDDGIPIAVRLLLIVRRDLEREGLAVLEHGPAVQAQAGDATHDEVDREDLAGFASRKITGRLVNGNHFAVRKRRRVETRSLFGVLVEPETDGVLRLHARLLLGELS